jgi:tripartite-type tricarboxylate transporter receptor subunit TctC
MAQTLPVDQILGSPGINFDFSKFNVVGRMATSGTVFVSWHTVPVKSIQDVQKTEITIAATGPSSEAFIVPAVLNNVVGTKFKIVSGYTGTQEMMIAMERREVDSAGFIVSSLTTQFARFLENKQVNALVQNSLKRDKRFPNVPTTIDLARNDEERDILTLFALGNEFGRSFVLPPGVPAETVAIWRKAFSDTMSDPELIAAAKKGGLDLEPENGESIQTMIAKISKTSPELAKKALAAKQWKR